MHTSLNEDRWLNGARELLPRAVELRRKIHQHPELGNDLPVTKAAVLDAIADLPLELNFSESTSGIVATLKGNQEGSIILLRGDMDALPMPEDTDLPYASQVEGRMHACGHDCHTAMLAGAARLLAQHRDKLKGSVKFMFQPGEEGPGGAKPMIEEGVLDIGGAPDAAFALHIYPRFRSGAIACRSNAILASSDTLWVKLKGKGGHGSMPHDAIDPVPVACELVQAFQTFVTRRFSPFDPVVLTVGRIEAGTVSNVIPEYAEMDITLRALSVETREKALAGVHRLANLIAAAHEMSAEVQERKGYPATINDQRFTEFVANTAREMLGEENYIDLPSPFMGAEDFSYVLQKMPGAFAFIGVAPEGVEMSEAPSCHSSRMLLNEESMVNGVAMHAKVAFDYLEQESSRT